MDKLTLFDLDLALVLLSFSRCTGAPFLGADVGADFCGVVFGMEGRITVSARDTVEVLVGPVGRDWG